MVSLGALVLTQKYSAIKPKSWNRVRQFDVVYPKKGRVGRNISAIYFYGAYEWKFKVLAGGIAMNFSSIRLTSKLGQPLNVTVKLYGAKKRGRY